ncbi:hypothetical protein EJB05_46206, partial [Eragrostis curvula]
MSLGGDVPRRGQSSCFHQWECADLHLPEHATVEHLIQQAVDLLPVEEMPVLLRCVVGGGGCFGVLDPVSNVVLNAVSYLDRLEHPPAEELARRGRLAGYEKFNEAEMNRIRESIDMASFGQMWLGFAAKKSMNGLTEFMENYFRYMSRAQAARYLQLARMDLSVALRLVHHDRFAAPTQTFISSDDLCSNRMLAALKLAALEAGLWAPVDDFVLLATSRYPRDLLEEATAPLLRRQKLSRDDIDRLLRLMQWRSNEQQLAGAGGGYNPVVHLTILRRPEDMDSMLSSCLQSMSMASPTPRRVTALPTPSHQADCDYIRCLKLCLLDSMHVLYLEAIARLPTATARRHIRGMMMAGHCYGLMDPVSNIVLNSMWYDTAFPPPPRDDGISRSAAVEEGDVLDNRCLLRLQRRSLNGLVALVQATGSLSEHEAVEFLCYNNCDISDNNVLQSAMHAALLSTHRNPFTTASEAAKHPRPLALGMFLASIAPEKMDLLRSLLRPQAGSERTTTLSHAAVEQIYQVLRREQIPQLPPVSVPALCPEASRTLAARKDAFKELQYFIRGTLQHLLCQYAASHQKEPRYDLGVICGAAVNDRRLLGSVCYHVNFLASSANVPDVNGPRRQTLFFAEFGQLGTRRDPKPDFRLDESEAAFCLPVAFSADYLGRCYHCEGQSSRILHPVSGRYHTNAGKDIKDSGLAFRYWNALGSEAEALLDREQLESDFVYFDHTRDAQFARRLNDAESRKQPAF